MKKIIIACTALLISIPALTMAQSIKNTLGIGPRLGYYKANDADEGNFYGGAQVRLRLGPNVGIEGALDYRAAQEYEIGFAGIDGGGEGLAKLRQVPLTGSFLLFLPLTEHFAPYGIAGLGAYYTILDFSENLEDAGLEDSEEVNFGFHLGFGLEIPFNEHVSLNADYRYLFLNPGNDSFEEAANDSDYSGNVVTAGLMFYL